MNYQAACRWIVAFAGFVTWVGVVHAQEEKKSDAAESAPAQPEAKPAAPTEKAEPAATQPDEAVPDAKRAAEPAPSTDTTAQPPTTQPPPQQSLSMWLIKSSGPIGLVIIIQSFLAVGLTIKYVIDMRRDKFIPQTLVVQFEAKLSDKKYQEAYEVARNSPSFLGKVLAAGLSKVSIGYPQAVEAMQEAGADESMKLEHQLSYLAILGTTGPLLGLLGTVVGMVMSFRVIATSETQPKPSQLAEGIATALVTTLEGMIVAIVSTVAFMLLRNQVARLVLEVEMASSNLMARFSSMARPGRGAAPAIAQTEQVG